MEAAQASPENRPSQELTAATHASAALFFMKDRRCRAVGRGIAGGGGRFCWHQLPHAAEGRPRVRRRCGAPHGSGAAKRRPCPLIRLASNPVQLIDLTRLLRAWCPSLRSWESHPSPPAWLRTQVLNEEGLRAVEATGWLPSPAVLQEFVDHGGRQLKVGTTEPCSRTNWIHGQEVASRP